MERGIHKLYGFLRIVYILNFYLVFCLLSPSCYAQSAEAGNGIAEQLSVFLDTALKPGLTTQKQGSINEMESLFQAPLSETKSVAEKEAKVIKAKMDKAASDRGLELRMDYLENLDGGIYNTQSGGFYKRRGYMELSWDLLKGGLGESKQKAEVLKKQLKLKKLKEANSKQGHKYSLLFNRIIYTFNQQKLNYLKRQKKLLVKKAEIDRKRFKNNQILYEKVINTKSKIRETQQMLSNIQEYNKNVNPVTPSKVKASTLPVVDIQLDTLLASIRNRSWRETMIKLKREIQRQKYHPANQIRLGPYLRQNIYNNPDGYVNNVGETQGDIRQFFSWGLSLAVPLNFSEEDERALQEARVEQFKAENKAEKQVEIKEALNTYYEYQYALNDYIEFYHKKASLLEKIRQHQARKRIDDQSYNPVGLLDYATTVMQLNFELADIQQRMYLKLLNLKEYLTDRSIRDVIEKHPIRDQVERFQAQRSIYMWSKGFLNFSNGKLLRNLSSHNIKGVNLSLGPQNQAREKAQRFIKKAHEQNVKVGLLIGDNQLFRPQNHQRLANLTREADELGAQALHLDVEPHTLPEWKGNKEKYRSQFLTMVKKAQKSAKERDLQLEISVPIWYEPEFYKKLYSYCDRIFIMAYKRKDILQLEETLTETLPLKKQKTTVALRPADFGKLPKFYEFTQNLKEKTGIHQFAIHDLKAFMSLNDSD